MTSEPTSFEPTTDRGRELRRAFGHFGTGVTVITTQMHSGPLGMTANSFSSISLDPPLVLWSPAKSSLRHDAFVRAPHFCIHVLSSDQFALAKHFATEGTDFSDFEWREGFFGMPTLDGCLAKFHCETFAVHPAGDHSVILGRVLQASFVEEGAAGLLFERGKFGQFTAFDDNL